MTEITKLHFNGVDYDVGAQIHAQTEKIKPVNADEVMIADSENSYSRKRVTVANLVQGAKYMNTQESPTFSDNKQYIAGVYSGKIYLTKEGFQFYRNANIQNISVTAIYNSNYTGCASVIIYNGYIYTVLYRTGSNSDPAKVFKCNIESDITVASNWEYIINIPKAASSDKWLLAGFDDDYFIVYYLTGSIIYIQQYDTSWNLVNTITTTETQMSNELCFAANKKYFIGYGSSVTNPVKVYLQDGTNKGTVISSGDCFCRYGWYYVQYNASYPSCPQCLMTEFDNIFLS